MNDHRPGSTTRTRVWSIDGDRSRRRPDHLATEEPMEIRLVAGGNRHVITVTMRTPGHDFELAAGFLHGEGVVRHRDDIAGISYCLDPGLDAAQHYNIVNVTLRPGVDPDLAPLARNVLTTSACGVCGKTSLDAVRMRGCPVVPPGPEVPAAVLHDLPATLRDAQGMFAATGGLHAAALFTPDGRMLALREDIGRHNAVDKLIGWAVLDGTVSLDRCILLVSGRASFEILQKSLAAGIPIVCAVSAPSSLAVDLAREFGVTLVGFLRDQRCNVYSHHERIVLPTTAPATLVTSADPA